MLSERGQNMSCGDKLEEAINNLAYWSQRAKEEGITSQIVVVTQVTENMGVVCLSRR